jgi:hypothetical protein
MTVTSDYYRGGRHVGPILYVAATLALTQAGRMRSACCLCHHCTLMSPAQPRQTTTALLDSCCMFLPRFCPPRVWLVNLALDGARDLPAPAPSLSRALGGCRCCLWCRCTAGLLLLLLWGRLLCLLLRNSRHTIGSCCWLDCWHYCCCCCRGLGCCWWPWQGACCTAAWPAGPCCCCWWQDLLEAWLLGTQQPVGDPIVHG